MFVNKFPPDKFYKNCRKCRGEWEGLDEKEKEELKSEYQRLEELPSLGLVSSEKLWGYLDHCNQCSFWFHIEKDSDHLEHDVAGEAASYFYKEEKHKIKSFKDAKAVIDGIQKRAGNWKKPLFDDIVESMDYWHPMMVDMAKDAVARAMNAPYFCDRCGRQSHVRDCEELQTVWGKRIFDDKTLIHRGSKANIYRGLHDGKPCVIKIYHQS